MLAKFSEDLDVKTAMMLTQDCCLSSQTTSLGRSAVHPQNHELFPLGGSPRDVKVLQLVMGIVFLVTCLGTDLDPESNSMAAEFI